MTLEHTPRLWKLLLIIGLAFVALWLSLIPALGALPVITSAILFMVAAVEAYLLIAEAHMSMVQAYTDRVRAMAALDPSQWNALGLANIPHVRIVWQGLPLQLWGDTGATVDQMRHFIETSNAATTSPERNWNTAEHPRRAWVELYGWLVRAGYIIPDSASGNKSYRFYPGKYRMLQAVMLKQRGEVDPIPQYIGNMRADEVVYHAEVISPTLPAPLEGG